jgi:hypothetical protein
MRDKAWIVDGRAMVTARDYTLIAATPMDGLWMIRREAHDSRDMPATDAVVASKRSVFARRLLESRTPRE